MVDAALSLADELCELTPFALFATKQAMWAILDIPSLEAAIQLENRNHGRPVWQDRGGRAHVLREAKAALERSGVREREAGPCSATAHLPQGAATVDHDPLKLDDLSQVAQHAPRSDPEE